MKLELCECRSIKSACINTSGPLAVRAKRARVPSWYTLSPRRREISYSGRFLRVDGVWFFAAGTATSRERTATANLILITRQPRRSPIAAGGIGVTLLPLECRSGSLRADSYLCATLGARDGRRSERAEKTEEGGCSTRDAHPLTVKPRPHSRDSSKSKYSRARPCKRIVLVAAGRFLLSSFILLSIYLSLSRLLLPSCVVAILFWVRCSSGFFSPSSPYTAITREGKHDADLSAGLSGDARVIYCDLIAFNSSGVTVNHRASRIARVRNVCCRYDVITSIRESARMRATIVMPRGAR